jgi:heme exporter protein CcmD
VTHFLTMGGYGTFVWSAYAVSSAALIVAVVLTMREYLRVGHQWRQMIAESEDSAP